MQNDRIKNANYFVKGDISGIQDFIFSVKSDGAAKSLKARSYFILALSKLCLRVLELKVGAENFDLLFDGGGNFYAFVKSDDDEVFTDVQKEVSEEFAHDNIYLSLSWCRFKAEKDLIAFGDLWKKLQEKSEEDKKKAYQNCFSAFSAFKKIEEGTFDWGAFTDKLKLAKGFELTTPTVKARRVNGEGIVLLGEQLHLTDLNGMFSDNIANKLPLWDSAGAIGKKYPKALKEVEAAQIYALNKTVIGTNGIIPFEYLAKFAKERTGTDKLGILKMDIDNLGEHFRQIKEYEQFKSLSERLSQFFSKTMLAVLNAKFGDDIFRNNIYPVFSGGDDCFFVGGWDAIFAFASAVRKAFEREFKDSLTMSAALTVVDSKFPVVRFAHLADIALGKAKNHLDMDGHKPKNHVAVFDEVLTWPDFEHAQDWAIKLSAYVDAKRLPKSTLWRLQRAKIGYGKLLHRATEQQQIVDRKVWRLAWYLRTGTKSDDIEVQNFIKKIVDECSRALLGVIFGDQAGLAPGVFPVAGRWAEFSTRKEN